MIENNNFPWYLQQSDTFVSLYNGFFTVAEAATPLGIGDAFNIDEMTGAMLYRLGTYWGMSGSPYIWDGLIYDLDSWSETKRWTGGIKEIGSILYSNMIKAKSYAFGRPFSLNTLNGVFERLFAGYPYTISVEEVGSPTLVIIDEGSVTDAVDTVNDLGAITDDVESIQNLGEITSSDFPINEMTIIVESTPEVIQAFIEMRAFDLMFIGKPTGIKINWSYNILS